MANSTDKSILTAAGKALLAQLNAEEKALVIDKMIFANVSNRPEYPQPDDVVPTDHIVHQEQVEQRGRLSADSVIYSSTLTSDVGPFDFNWTGAYCSEYGVLVTIDHHALTPKTADEPGVAGNTLVRSVVLEYKDIAEITNITVDASSWQYNATERMKKMDSDVAQSIIDQNGKDWFIEDGFLVTPSGSAYSIKAGAGYVSGNRVAMEFDRSVQVPNKPSFIYIDAHREGTPTGEQVTLFNFVVTAEEKDDYIDSSTGKDVKHFVCKIAQVLGDGSVSDLRPEGESAGKSWTKDYVGTVAGNLWVVGDVVKTSSDVRVFEKDGMQLHLFAPSATNENPILMTSEPDLEIWRIKAHRPVLEAKGDGGQISVPLTKLPSDVVKIKMSCNSNKGMTLNGYPIKILDTHATEESQWTHSGINQASKNKPKEYVYRTVFQNALSEDVVYDFLWQPEGEFWQVFVDKIYKHGFVECGFGCEITELQDAIQFATQFSLAKYIDPLFQNVNEETDFYPNKPQISIAIPSGTISEPSISVMNKPIRMGEHNLNGIEIINSGRYDNNTDFNTCLIEYAGVLGNDDLGFLNIWKTDLGEVHGIKFVFKGEFNKNHQYLVRYARTEARFKNCCIDISEATWSNENLYNIGGLYCDRDMESFGCEMILPERENPFHCFDVTNNLVNGWAIKGNPKVLATCSGVVDFDSVIMAGQSKYLVHNITSAIVSFHRQSTVDTIAVKYGVDSMDAPLHLFVDKDTSIGQAYLDKYKGRTTVFSKQLRIFTEGMSIEGDGARPKSTFVENGVTKSGVGLFEHTSGLEISGNGVEGHWSVDETGTFYPNEDGLRNIGYESKRVNDIFLSNNPVVTSDARVKKEPEAIPDGLLNFVMNVEIKQYQLKENNSNRYHYGIVVTESFLKELDRVYSLDKCAALCHSIFTDNEGHPVKHDVGGVQLGDIWQVRYAEWQNLLLEALRRKVKEIKC
ncbi:phage tail protein [Vibrio sp. D173a]|uniref:phage tail-collar fiber domain-containing protein n=1 Tax=Vibrio sp. D173a TaxID=2836349 RepID=UPI0025568FB7|nr:phage tail protein [Vibrio sp. D173a]MDK9756972.1 phage tail protein [Vibrio sp. D173a]